MVLRETAGNGLNSLLQHNPTVGKLTITHKNILALTLLLTAKQEKLGFKTPFIELNFRETNCNAFGYL